MSDNNNQPKIQSKCDKCDVNGATPLQHCDRCNKNICQHCHPEPFIRAKKHKDVEVDHQISQVSLNKKLCKYCVEELDSKN